VQLERLGMALTCNAVAQGYITDRIAGLLQARGFSHTLLDLGERRALGGHPQGRPWRLGVVQPGRPGEIAGVVELEGQALATSGAYGQRFADGRHHLLEARRGECREDFASVTVVAPSAAVADVLATCLAVVPPAEARPVLDGLGPAEVWVVRPGVAYLEPWVPPCAV
jgi:thiamine biosynthesis lipoprotein